MNATLIDSNQADSCYGGLFPELAATRYNQHNRGRVFGVRVEKCGVGIQNKDITVDREAWANCLKCPDFDDCYKLSMAKLAFESGVQTFFHN